MSILLSEAEQQIHKQATQQTQQQAEQTSKYPKQSAQKQSPQKQPVAQLALTAGCGATGKTILKQRYMSYPLSVSPIFRLDNRGSRHTNSAKGSTKSSAAERVHRAYLYRMNTSPGLLAGDVLGMSLKLEAGSSLLLADQAATKVHTMPAEESAERGTDKSTEKPLAKVNYDIEVGDRATLEFLPEPLILFADSTLNQTTNITLHPTAGLTWGEIILPGRLARGERYQFQAYLSRMQIKSSDDIVWFVEAMKLLGKANPFTQSALFANGSVLGTLILALPEEMATQQNLTWLSQQIDQLNETCSTLELASSILPGERGLFVRAIAHTTRDLQFAFKAAASCVRQLRSHPPLPYSL